jgi:uncharacterized protein YkwD
MILPLMFLFLHEREPQEVKLFNIINEYRVQKGKTRLQYSDSLSYVAEIHSIDLNLNFKEDNPCSLHSWSDSKLWTGGCIPEGKNDKWSIMYDKPKELLGMNKPAYEIAVMNFPEKFSMSPELALKWWLESTPHKKVILEDGWPKPFKKMGVSIYKNVSTVWFSE